MEEIHDETEKGNRRDIAAQERDAIRRKFPDEFKKGFLAGQIEYAPYPKNFQGWPLERRNAWFARYNASFSVWHPKAGHPDD